MSDFFQIILAKITTFITVVMITITSILPWSGNNVNKPVDTTPQVPKSELIINELTSRHNALKDWSSDISYTIQLQEKIIGKPVLYIGSIDDIFLREGKTFIKVSSSYLEEVSYTLELECDKQLVEKARNRPTGEIFNDYAVIAQLENILKPSVKLVADSISGEESSYVDFDSSDLFIGNGKCIDLAYIEEDD